MAAIRIPAPSWETRVPARPRPRLRAIVRHLAYGALAVVLFPVAIHVLQAGAGAVAAPLRDTLAPCSLPAVLGLGWLVSVAALSGSPVAAGALALLDGGALDERQAFAMVVGTRFGAITVALTLGALYSLGAGGSRSGREVGVLAFLTTQLVAWASLGVGLLLLPWHAFALTLPRAVLGAFDRAAKPATAALVELLPGWSVFVIGVAGVLLALRCIDLALPAASAETVEKERWWTRNRFFLFALGLAVTLVTPSVTISVGLLVPLHAKGWTRTARFVPYVLGANIAAFSDTLLAALLLGNAVAVNVVLTEIVSIALVSGVVLLACHDVVEGLIVRAAAAIAARPWAFAAFYLAAILAPVALTLG